MRRREFIKALGGAAAAWPLAARGQQPGERVPRIGVLLSATPDDAQNQAWLAAFLQGLAQSGRIVGRNVQIDTRWATANADAVSKHAAELAALQPDAILAAGASTVGPLLKVTRTVPIVFAAVADPVGAGFVESLARWRQRHRVYGIRIQYQRKMVGTAQGVRAKFDPSRGTSGS